MSAWVSFYCGAVLGVFLGLLIAGLLTCAREDHPDEQN